MKDDDSGVPDLPDDFESAYLQYLESSPGVVPDITDVEARNERKRLAEQLLERAVGENEADQADVIEVVTMDTPLNKNDARKMLNDFDSQAQLEVLSFESVKKIVSPDPERDPRYVVTVRVGGESGTMMLSSRELLSVGSMNEKLLSTFDVAPLKVKRNDWTDYVNEVLSDLVVEVKSEDPTRPEHVAAEMFLAHLKRRCDVVTHTGVSSLRPGNVLFDSESGMIKVPDSTYSEATLAMQSDASRDAVAAILVELGVSPESPLRAVDGALTRVWHFDADALIAAGVFDEYDVYGEGDS
jgi:hypothetical protein